MSLSEVTVLLTKTENVRTIAWTLELAAIIGDTAVTGDNAVTGDTAVIGDTITEDSAHTPYISTLNYVI